MSGFVMDKRLDKRLDVVQGCASSSEPVSRVPPEDGSSVGQPWLTCWEPGEGSGAILGTVLREGGKDVMSRMLQRASIAVNSKARVGAEVPAHTHEDVEEKPLSASDERDVVGKHGGRVAPSSQRRHLETPGELLPEAHITGRVREAQGVGKSGLLCPCSYSTHGDSSITGNEHGEPSLGARPRAARPAKTSSPAVPPIPVCDGSPDPSHPHVWGLAARRSPLHVPPTSLLLELSCC
ncbi:hypothetical protein CB1_000637006 [Camelus ferus]|nr:hypothetical protein CB1_000637006 [Camelus ferus]